MRNKLPETCFSTLASTGELIIIKRGERGYYRSEWSTDDSQENRALANELNQKSKVNAAQRFAMECGSMVGWSVPGADPQSYLDDAVHSGTWPIRGHMKDTIMTVYYPIQCDLERFKIGGTEQFYLPLDSIPESWLEFTKDIILLPDLVRGKPYLPVQAEWSSNGSCTVRMESDCFSGEKEVNTGYQITAKVRVGNAEFAIGEHPKAPAPFATWERNLSNDKDGPPNYFWGHYLNDRKSALLDFCERAQNEYDFYVRRKQPMPQQHEKRKNEPER